MTFLIPPFRLQLLLSVCSANFFKCLSRGHGRYAQGSSTGLVLPRNVPLGISEFQRNWAPEGACQSGGPTDSLKSANCNLTHSRSRPSSTMSSTDTHASPKSAIEAAVVEDGTEKAGDTKVVSVATCFCQARLL